MLDHVLSGVVTRWKLGRKRKSRKFSGSRPTGQGQVPVTTSGDSEEEEEEALRPRLPPCASRVRGSIGQGTSPSEMLRQHDGALSTLDLGVIV